MPAARTLHADPPRRRRKRFMPFTLLSMTLLAFATWLMLNAGAIREFLAVYYERNSEQEHIEMLQQRIRILSKQQLGLKYNGFEAEKQARERIGLKKPGEQVIYVKPPQDESVIPAALPAEETTTSATQTPPLEIVPGL